MTDDEKKTQALANLITQYKQRVADLRGQAADLRLEADIVTGIRMEIEAINEPPPSKP